MEDTRAISYAGRTLVVVLCMHRSGSSFATNVLQRLGMSLGPFEILGATEHNKHGHFEAVPGFRLDQRVLAHVFGFGDEMPATADVLNRFLKCEGRWSMATAGITDELIEEGRRFLRQLVASGEVSGFKDPRVPLAWPFWERVLAEFDGLRVVTLFLARSPHEIAMSLFARSRGDISYYDALDVTAVHLKRLSEIRESWSGPSAVVCFDPARLADDLRQAAAVCGLEWNDQVLAEVYDAACRHHEPASVAHEAEVFYRRLCGAGDHGAANQRLLEKDAALREDILRTRAREFQQEINVLTQQACDLALEKEQYRRQLEAERRDAEDARARIRGLENQLALIRGSRTWKLRGRLVAAFQRAAEESR